MENIIIAIVVLTIVVLAWSKLSKAMDWTGDRIGQATDVVDHVFEAGTKQTARGVIISDKALDDTKLDRIQAKKTWATEYKAIIADLDEEQTKRVIELEDWMAKL